MNWIPYTADETIKTSLLVTPRVDKRYCFNDVAPFILYKEQLDTPEELLVPRFYDDPPHPDTHPHPFPTINVNFDGQLRENQREPYMRAIHHLSNYGGGILQLPCGFGKTPLSIAIMCHLKCKTIFIVHRENLVDQMYQSLVRFVPGVKIGVIQGTSNLPDCSDYDVIIAMVHSLIRLTPEQCLQMHMADIGFAVFDEVDIFGSSEFSRTFRDNIIEPKYVLGMSATPKRKDGCHKMFELFLGEYILKTKLGGNYDEADRKKYSQVLCRTIRYTTPNEWKDQFNFKGGPEVNKMYNMLMNDDARTICILQTIRQLMVKDPSRHVLILSSRREHVNLLANYLEHDGVLATPIKIGRYMGGSNKKDRDIAFACKIIVATVQSASVGMNIPTLDTLILALPHREMVQACGRIGRGIVQNPLLIIDFVDHKSPYFRKWYDYRAGIYKRLGIVKFETMIPRGGE